MAGNKMKSIGIPIAVILIGVVIFIGMTMMKKKPTRQAPPNLGVLVNVITAKRTESPVLISGSGTVAPRWQVALQPEVTGRVVWVAPGMVSGGSFRTGDPMVKIGTMGYHLAVQQAEAAVAKAEYSLVVAKANADIAKKQWDLVAANRRQLAGMETTADEPPNPLVLNEPQMLDASAGLKSAQAQLERAQLNLRRATITAPFNCRVRTTTIAVGQLVSPSMVIGNLYSSDLAEIEVGLPVSELEWLNIPGSPAEIFLDDGTRKHSWKGKIVRSLGVVDQAGRLARVVVQITDPMSARDGGIELSMGSFVSVTLEGKKAVDVIPIPRKALREGLKVWTLKADNTLNIRTVVVERLTTDQALVKSGLEDGDIIILTNVVGGAEGLKLRPVAEEPAQ